MNWCFSNTTLSIGCSWNVTYLLIMPWEWSPFNIIFDLGLYFNILTFSPHSSELILPSLLLNQLFNLFIAGLADLLIKSFFVSTASFKFLFKCWTKLQILLSNWYVLFSRKKSLSSSHFSWHIRDLIWNSTCSYTETSCWVGSIGNYFSKIRMSLVIICSCVRCLLLHWKLVNC